MKINRISTLITLIILCAASACAQDFQRIKGYYRIWQTTDSALTYFWDGYMEVFVPVSDAAKEDASDFCERKLLGERRRKAPNANGDDLYIQINLPNLEVQPLASSIEGEEYSTRYNGDVYMLSYKAGHISHTDSTTTITMDELAGRAGHELDMSQLKMYGVVATMTRYEETETRKSNSRELLSFSKRMSYRSHYKGEDEDEQIDVVSDFYATDRQNVTKAEMKKILKAKNHIWNFNVPANIPALPDEVAKAWPTLVEY
jgi:hypothetical protein